MRSDEFGMKKVVELIVKYESISEKHKSAIRTLDSSTIVPYLLWLAIQG